MNKKLITALSMTIAISMATTTWAKNKKNAPRNNSAIEKALEEASEGHAPEKMKISKIGPVETGETFYHAYTGIVKKEPYRILIFDNKPSYLGYYSTELEPVNYEEGAILLKQGNSIARIPIPEKGPAAKIQLDSGVIIRFFKNKNLTVKKEESTETKAIAVPTEKSKSGMEINYREWTISMNGKKIPFRAMFVKKEGSKVFLKDEKRGITKDFSFSKLSLEDRKYIQKLEK